MIFRLTQRFGKEYQEPFYIECDSFSYHALTRDFTYVKDNQIFVETKVVGIYLESGYELH